MLLHTPDDRTAFTAVQQIAFSMVSIPAGTIALKDEGTDRWWTVRLQPFLINRFAVTKEQYAFIVHSGVLAKDDLRKPVVDISWNDAIQFCNLLSRKAGLPECYSQDASGKVSCDWNMNGYRLPTEAEWEFACRAGSNEARYGELHEIAWYQDNSGQKIHDVGEKKPNEWGLYDMIGNVWEWCWDVYDEKIYGPYRVFRGGGWCDAPRGCRASCRRKSHPTFRIDDLGIRLARSVKSS